MASWEKLLNHMKKSSESRKTAEKPTERKRPDRRLQALRGAMPDVKRQTFGFRSVRHVSAALLQNVWTQDDPASLQLYLGGGGRLRFLSRGRIELKPDDPMIERKMSTVLPPIVRQPSNARRESLAFLNNKSTKSKEQSLLRFPQLSEASDQQRISVRQTMRSWKSQPDRRSASSRVKAKVVDLERFISSLVSQSLAERTSIAPSEESDEAPPHAPPIGTSYSLPVSTPPKATPPKATPQALMNTLVRSITETVISESSSLEEELNDPHAVIEFVKNRLNQEDMHLLIRKSGLRVVSDAAQMSGLYQPAIEAYEAALKSPIAGSPMGGSRTSSLTATSSMVFADVERHLTETEQHPSVLTDGLTLLDVKGISSRYSKERRDLMSGGITKIPQTQKRTVRLYICSSYSDMKDERGWLMRYASLKLQQMARQYNIDILTVDLKWGLPEDISSDPQNLPVYLEEIRYCREQSIGPAFVVLIGDRYGNQELPTSIPVDLFHLMLRILSNLKISNGELLRDWYQLDENATPPVFRLAPITARIPNFGLMEYGTYNDQIRKTAARQWFNVEQALRDTMEKILLVGQDEGSVSSDVADLFSLSVVEKEIREGLLSRQTRYCVFYERRIDSLENSVNKEMAPRYIDVIIRNEQRSVDRVKQRKLEILKSSIAAARRLFVVSQPRIYEAELWENQNEVDLVTETQMKRKVSRVDDEDQQDHQGYMLYEGTSYLRHYKLDWDEALEAGIPTAEEKAFMTAESEVYRYKVVADFVQDCKDMVNQFLFDRKRMAFFVDHLAEEVIEHARVCSDRVDRCAADGAYDLAKVEATVRAFVEKGRTLVVRGESGSGVTTYVAQIASHLREWFGAETVVVMRFLGSTPGSMSITNVLTTVSYQLAELYALPRPRGLDHDTDLRRYFQSTLEAVGGRLTATQRLFIILDGLEKLSAEDGEAHSLGWIPLSFPPFIHLVLSASHSSKLVSRNLQILFSESATTVEPDPLNRDAALQIIRSTLMGQGRTLTDQQVSELVQIIEAQPLPLYVCLLAKEAALWQSSYQVNRDDLPPTVDRAVAKLLASLEDQLGLVFVRNAISYLTVSEGGLSEVEWQDALACDDEVLEEVFQFTDPSNSAVRCPQLLIARLRYRLGDLLVQVDDYGIPVFFWHQRSIVDAIVKRYLRDGEQKNEVYHYCNRVLADLFFENESVERTLYLRKRQIVLERADRMVTHRVLVPQNRRKLQKLPRFLYHSGPEWIVREELKNKVLCSVPWLMAKLRGLPFSEVLADFEMLREKDDDILLIERILRDAADSISKHPELLQLEIAGRFSSAKHASSDCIRRMVIHSKKLQITATRIMLFPIYPGLPRVDRSLKATRQGSTHLLGIHDLRYGIVWGKRNGLEVLELTPVMRSLYRIGASVELDNIRLSRDRLYLFYVRRSVLFKWCVTTGELLGQSNLLAEVLPPSLLSLAAGRAEQEVFQPLAVNADCSRLIVKINFEDLMMENCALIVVDAADLKFIGLTGDGLASEDITHVEVFKDHLYVTITSSRKSPETQSASSQLFYFKHLTSRSASGFMRIPPRVSHIPGCFRILEGNSVYIACIGSEDSDRTDGQSPRSPEPQKRVVALHVTEIGLLIVLFASDADGGHSSLVIHGVDGTVRGRSTSKETRPTCLSMAKDNATAFVGYESGVIEAYHVPSAVRGHSFSAHRGPVNCIEEADPLMIYTTGADECLRLFDLTVTPLAMDFTRADVSEAENQPFEALSDDEAFKRRTADITYLDLGRSQSDVSRMVIGYAGKVPIVATHDGLFSSTRLKIPGDIDVVTKAWLVVEDDVVIGVGYGTTTGQPHRMLRWNRKADVIDGPPLTFADLCAVTTDRENYLLLRKRKRGCTAVAYEALTGRKLKKYRSHDDVTDRTDDVMISSNLAFAVLVQPSKRRLVLWHLAEIDSGPGQEDVEMEFPSEKDPCDDDQCLKDPGEIYVDGQHVEASVLATAALFANIRDVDQPRSRFVVKLPFLTAKAVALSGNLLAAGTENGALVCVDLDQFNEYVKAQRQKPWQWNGFIQVCERLHNQPINCVCVAQDNRYVISGANDNIVRVYNTVDKDVQATLVGHTKPVLCVAISSRSQFVVSGSSDCTVRLWNAFSGRPLTVFSSYQDVFDVQFFGQVDDALKVSALVDQFGQRHLMLFSALNLITTNKMENF